MIKYSKQIENQESVAKATGTALPISAKQAIEICNALRGKSVQRAKKILDDVITEKVPMPFKRFEQMGHKKGNVASGRYPIKACMEILSVLNSAEANAQFKGLNTSSLNVTHIAANRAPKQWHYGRQKRREMKRTHIQIILEEKEGKSQNKKEDKRK